MEKLSLGSTGFAQVGDPEYHIKQQVECAVLTEALEKKFKWRITACRGRLVWQSHQHDFGEYHDMELHVPEDKVNWNLVNDLEAFDWDNEILIAKMQEIFNKINPAKATMTEIQRLAHELEEMGAVVILPEDQMASEPKEGETKEPFDLKKGSFKAIDIEDFDMADLEDSVVPACCKYGCQVEPDGYCEHGNPSVLINAGII